MQPFVEIIELKVQQVGFVLGKLICSKTLNGIIGCLQLKTIGQINLKQFFNNQHKKVPTEELNIMDFHGLSQVISWSVETKRTVSSSVSSIIVN